MKNLVISCAVVSAIFMSFAFLTMVMPESVKEDYNIIQSYNM